MTATFVDLIPRPGPAAEVEVIDDLEGFLVTEKCSCSAGDDQPY